MKDITSQLENKIKEIEKKIEKLREEERKELDEDIKYNICEKAYLCEDLNIHLRKALRIMKSL